MIEANILGINAVKVVMSGGHYKQCLIAHISDHNGNPFTTENATNCDIDVDERGLIINIFTDVVANDTFFKSFLSA